LLILFSLTFQKVENEIIHDTSLTQVTSKVANHVLNTARKEADRLLLLEKPIPNIESLLEQGLYWRDALYWAVENCNEELRNRVSTQTHDNQLSVLPSGLVNSVFTYYLTQISRVIIRLCLDAYPAADYSVLQTTFVDEYFEEISNVVRKHMSGRKELGYLQLNPKYDLVDSCYAALIKLLPPLPENRVIREENDKLGKFLEDLLISGPDASQKTKSLNNIEQKLQTKNFRISLTNFLQFSTTSILKSVLKALSEVSLPQDNLIYQRSFIHYVLESCFSEMIKRRQKSHGYELMPSKVQKANIVSAFGCMLNELFTHKTYRIFFIIINLSLGQRLLEMDGVIFIILSIGIIKNTLPV
jgi:hypothetical protein